MNIKTKTIDNVGVLTLKGKLMGEPASSEIRDEIKSFFGENIKNIVVDLKHVSWMNSLGIGALMGAYTTVINAGGEFHLSGVAEKVKSVMIITKLMRIFKTFDTVDDAVAGFGK